MKLLAPGLPLVPSVSMLAACAGATPQRFFRAQPTRLTLFGRNMSIQGTSYIPLTQAQVFTGRFAASPAQAIVIQGGAYASRTWSAPVPVNADRLLLRNYSYVQYEEQLVAFPRATLGRELAAFP